MLAISGLSGFDTSQDGGRDIYTSVLLHCDGTDAATSFPDSGGSHTIVANGDAQVDTAQSKFGGASALCDGTGDYLSTTGVTSFGSGAWAIDHWVRFAALPANTKYMPMPSLQNAAVMDGLVLLNTAAVYKLNLYLSSNGTTHDIANAHVGTSTSWAINTWYHIALTFDGAKYRSFVNGVADDTVTSATVVGGAMTGFYAGSQLGAPAPMVAMNGWYDEIRLSIGHPRWTAAFTVPASAYF